MVDKIVLFVKEEINIFNDNIAVVSNIKFLCFNSNNIGEIGGCVVLIVIVFNFNNGNIIEI